ncbi:MAG: hypothetical protein WC856_02350 [Methylococcaceae bacterium]|jgi:hypothetical protein
MSHLDRILSILMFLGDEITDKQCSRLMDDARVNLYPSELGVLKNNINCPSSLYTALSEYEGEIGGFGR